MLYVVCAYIGLCLVALVVLPGKTTDVPKERSSLFEKGEKIKCPEDDDIEKLVDELLKDV